MQKAVSRYLLSICLLAWGQLSIAQSWQQKLRYTINTELDENNHEIHGDCSIDYINNSPDTLKYIILHLYPNAFKNDKSYFAKQFYQNGKTDFYFSKKSEKGYIDSLFFTINGKECFYSQYLQNEDVVYLDLPNPLHPGDSLKIYTPYRVKIPKQFSRLGHNGNDYFLSQWYPKPAVYDSQGWHPIPYAEIGEFYGEYADFEVNITLPESYVVATSGVIQDSSEYSFLESKKWNKNDKHDIESENFINQTENTKTIHSTQSNVHDFAWSASRNFRVVHDTVLLQNHIVDIFAYATSTGMKDFHKSLDHAKTTLHFLSENIGEYPYSQVHLVQNLTNGNESIGGMEYPTYTIIHSSKPEMTRQVIFHEVAHNWFYGLLGNNERKEPFMDESFTSFLDHQIEKTYQLNQPKNANQKVFSLNDEIEKIFLGRSKYYRIDLPATEYSEAPYGILIYGLGRQYIEYLQDYLGDEAFYQLMRGYFAKYEYHHHSFQNFQDYIESHANKDVKWFAMAYHNSQYPIDFKIPRSGLKSDQHSIKIINHGDIALPAKLQVICSDSTYSFWTAPLPPDETNVKLPYDARLKNIRLNPDNTIPEINNKNNDWKKRFRVGPLTNPNLSSHQRELYFLPTLGYNYYDGFMAGLAFHNFNGIKKKFDYWINPMWGFRAKTLVGNAWMHKNWVTYNSSIFKSVDLSLSVKSFDERETNRSLSQNLLFRQYIRIKPELTLNLDNGRMDDKKYKKITAGFYYIQKNGFGVRYKLSDSSTYIVNEWEDPQYFGKIAFSMKNDRLYNPYSYELSTHLNEEFVKLLAEASIKINYNYKKKGIHLRGFGGWMTASDQVGNDYFFQSTNSNSTDYLYDHTIIGRNIQEGLLSNQIFSREGGFKSPTPFLATPVGIADQWMMALNSRVEVPFKLPISIYLDLATFNNATERLADENKVLLNSGLSLNTKILDIYLPLFYSKDYKEYFMFNTPGKWYNRISFNLKIDLLDISHIERLF